MALRCAREFHYRYVDKIPEPEVMPETRIGKAIHAALEMVLQGIPAKEAKEKCRAELTDRWELARFDNIGAGIEPFVERIARFRREKTIGRELIEHSLAMREDCSATQFYAGDAFFRGVFDLAYLFANGQMALVDHKTGVRHLWHTTTEQLEGYAVLAAANFRTIRRYWLGIHWVADSDIDWAEPVDPATVRERMTPNVLNNIEAAALAVDDGPRANPSDFCERCSYRSICPAAREIRYQPVEDEGLDEAE